MPAVRSGVAGTCRTEEGCFCRSNRAPGRAGLRRICKGAGGAGSAATLEPVAAPGQRDGCRRPVKAVSATTICLPGEISQTDSRTPPQEQIRFDLQKRANRAGGGVQYRQGSEIRVYPLKTLGRTLRAGRETLRSLIDQLHATATGGINRIDTLTRACGPCHHEKDSLDIEVFLMGKAGNPQTHIHPREAPAHGCRPSEPGPGLRARFTQPCTLLGPDREGDKNQRDPAELPQRRGLAAFSGMFEEKVVFFGSTIRSRQQGNGRGSGQRTKVDASGFHAAIVPGKSRIRASRRKT